MDHVVTGSGTPPIVFVHGFGCARGDWDAQVAQFSPRHQTVAVDLRGHGTSPGSAEACSIERFGADVAEVMRALDLASAVLVGHSMGCRVVTEAALQAPERTAGVVLVDGSQFAAGMAAVMDERFAQPDGYRTMVNDLFVEMFTAKSNSVMVASVIERAKRLPRPIGEKLLRDMQRYDVGRLTSALGCLRVPAMAVQTTYSNEKRERRPLHQGQTSPYLDMLRGSVPSVRIEVIADTGHFPQLEANERTNAAIEGFVRSIASTEG